MGYPQYPDPLAYPDPLSPAPPYTPNAVPEPEPVAPTPIKIVIAGGFGVGKTTTVGVISDPPPLTTEAAMTDVAAEIDRTGEVPEKTTTTVAIDFGTIRLDDDHPARPHTHFRDHGVGNLVLDPPHFECVLV